MDCQTNTIVIRVLWAIVWAALMYALRQCVKVLVSEWATTKGSVKGIWGRSSGKMTLTSVLLCSLIIGRSYAAR